MLSSVITYRFLWLTFQLEDICRQGTDDAIRGVLESLPRGLDATYARILQRIVEDRDSNVAKKVLKLLSAVRHLVTLAEVHEAVAIEPGDVSWIKCGRRLANDPRKMLHNCGNLAICNTDNIVQFAHKTVLDFLQSEYCPAEFHADQNEADNYVAEICLTYLNFADFETAVAPIPAPSLPNALSVPLSTWIPQIAGQSTVARLIQKGFGWAQQFRQSDEPKDSPTVAQLIQPHIAPRPPLTPLEELGENFVFLRYVVENWLHHSLAIKPSNGSY